MFPAKQNMFVAEYDSSGALNWTILANNNFDNWAMDIVSDKAGNSYLSGTTACCLPGYDMFVAKYDMEFQTKSG